MRVEKINNKFKGTYAEKIKQITTLAKSNFANCVLPYGYTVNLGADAKIRYDYTNFCLSRRRRATIAGVKKAKKKLNGIISQSKIETFFAYANSMALSGGYNYSIDDKSRITLAAAIWILDELTLNGKLNELYQYLPESEDLQKIEDGVIFKVIHPVYDVNLIEALVHLIRHRNTSAGFSDKEIGTIQQDPEMNGSDCKSIEFRTKFDAIISLLDPNRIAEATAEYENNVWEYYSLTFKAYSDVDDRLDQIHDRLSNLTTLSLKKQSKSKAFSAPFSYPMNMDQNTVNSFRTENNSEIDELKKEFDRLARNITFSNFSCSADRERLIRDLSGITSESITTGILKFHVSDPFKSSFALLYLLDQDSDIPWYYFGSLSVAETVRDQLPFDTKIDECESPILLDKWNETLYCHRYGGERWDNLLSFDFSGNAPKASPLKRKYGNSISQLIFASTHTLIPRVVPDQPKLHEFLESVGSISEEERNAYSLLSYTLVAGNIRTKSVSEHWMEQKIEKMLADNEGDKESDAIKETAVNLEAENKELKNKKKEMLALLGSTLTEKKIAKKEAENLRERLEIQEKELADLREVIFHLINSNDEQLQEDSVISFPYDTGDRKILSFGGHESWLKQMRSRFPGVTFVAPEALPNIDLIRNSDEIWIQVNKLSHADFFRIIKTVRSESKPLHYFSYEGVEKCAAELAQSQN